MATEKKKIPDATTRKPKTEAGSTDAGTEKEKKAASAAEKPANGAKKAPAGTTSGKSSAASAARPKQTTKKTGAAAKTSAAKTTKQKTAAGSTTGKSAAGAKKTTKAKNTATGAKKPKPAEPIAEPTEQPVTAPTPPEAAPRTEAALPVPAAENAPAPAEPLPAMDFPEAAEAQKKSFAGRVLFLLAIAAILLASYFIFLHRPGSYSEQLHSVAVLQNADGTTAIAVDGTVRRQVSGVLRDRQYNARGTTCVLQIGNELYLVKNRSVAKIADEVKDFVLASGGSAVAWRDSADTLCYLRIGQKEAPVRINNVHDDRYCLSPNGRELAYTWTWEQNGVTRLRVYSTSGHEVHIEQDAGLYPVALADKGAYLYYTDASGALYLQSGSSVVKLADGFLPGALAFNDRFDEVLFARADRRTVWVKKGTSVELSAPDGTDVWLFANERVAVRDLPGARQYVMRTFARNYYGLRGEGGTTLAYLKGGRKDPGALTEISAVNEGSVRVTDKAVWFLLTEAGGRTALHRVAAGRTSEKLLLWDVASYCPNVDGSRFIYTLDDGALHSATVGLFRTKTKRLCDAVDPDRLFVTTDDVFYFFRTDGKLCRSDNGDEPLEVADGVEALKIDGHTVYYAVREAGEQQVFANYRNRRRDTAVARGVIVIL